MKLRAKRVATTLEALRKANTKEELRDLLARAQAFKMNPDNVGEVRAAMIKLHEIEEMDSRIRAAKDDLKSATSLRDADMLNASIEKVRGLKDLQIDTSEFESELEKLRERDRIQVEIETQIKDAISLRSLSELKRAISRAASFDGYKIDGDLLKQAHKYLTVLEEEMRDRDVALKNLKNVMMLTPELTSLRLASKAARACMEYEKLKTNQDYQRVQKLIHDLELKETRQKAAREELKSVIDEVRVINYERLRRAISNAKEAELFSNSDTSLLRRCENMLQEFEKQRANSDRAMKMLCDALKLTNFDVRKQGMLEMALESAKNAGLAQDSEVMCDARSYLSKLRWKRSIHRVITVRRITTTFKMKKNDHDLLLEEFKKDLKDAEALKSADARIIALREVLDEANEADKMTINYREALKRLKHYEHEMEVRRVMFECEVLVFSPPLSLSLPPHARTHSQTHVCVDSQQMRDDLVAKLRGAMSTKNCQLIELMLENMSSNGIRVEEKIIEDAKDTVAMIKQEQLEIRDALKSLQVAMESCSIIKLRNAILDAERLHIPFDFVEMMSKTLTKAKEIRDEIDACIVKYEDIESELSDALKIQNSKLIRAVLKKKQDLEDHTNRLGEKFHFDLKVWKHECSTIESSKTHMLESQARKHLKLLDMRERNKFDAIQALEHAIKSRDLEELKVIVSDCKSLSIESSKFRVAKNLIEHLETEEEQRKTAFKILQHAVEMKSIELLESALITADRVGLPMVKLEGAKSLLSCLKYEAEEISAVNTELSNLGHRKSDLNLLSEIIARAESVGIDDRDDRLRDAKNMMLDLLGVRRKSLWTQSKKNSRESMSSLADFDDEKEITEREKKRSFEEMMRIIFHRNDDLKKNEEPRVEKLLSDAFRETTEQIETQDEEKMIMILSRIGRREDDDAEGDSLKMCSAQRRAIESSSCLPLPSPSPPSQRTKKLQTSSSHSKTQTRSKNTFMTKRTERGSIFRPRDHEQIFAKKSLVRETMLDEDTAKKYANIARRIIHHLWHVFTYYTLRTSPEDPFHMTTNGALNFVRDCCCSGGTSSSSTSSINCCGGRVTFATSRTFTALLRNGLLHAGSNGRLMFGDFIRLVSSLAVPCEDAVCMYCSVQCLETNCFDDVLIEIATEKRTINKTNLDRFLSFVSFVETKIVTRAKIREPLSVESVTSCFQESFEHTFGNEFVSILRSFYHHYASSSRVPIFSRSTFTSRVEIKTFPQSEDSYVSTKIFFLFLSPLS